MKSKIIGIIGASYEDEHLNKIAEEMGFLISKNNYSLVTGGRTGVMENACKGFKKNKEATGKTIGILPGIDKGEGNKYLDIEVPTGIGWARNQIVVLSSDIVIAIGGGAGTLSEIAYSWAYGKKVLTFEGVKGWSNELADKQIDDRRKDKTIKVKTPEEAINIIKENL